MSSYSGLRRAQLSLDYLHANSTTHEFLFGALAEMVDNSRDAQATQLEIFDLPNLSLRGGFALCFLDDGEGMLPEETARIVTFGYSEKRAKSDNLIGMYGNGLKSGSMRIGNDLIVFTKKNNMLTVLFLSRSFHESEHLIEVIVPVPSFDATTKKPVDDGDPELHKQEIDIILKYSPFKTVSDLMVQFDRITSESGTLVIIFNLKLLDTGEPELQFTSGDVVLANPPGHEFDSDEVLHDEQKSFAAYCAILYMDPRMKIYIQGVKVRTRKLLADLYKPKMYKYSSARFKTRSEGEVKKAEVDASKYDYLAREAESKARDLQKRCAAQLTNLKLRQECRRADEEASRLRQQALLFKHLAERKKRELKDPKTLTLYFGVKLNNRDCDGAFVYNCSRLISMYHRLYDGVPRGLVAIVDVPYLVLEPTHNKQDFADAKEFRHLMRALSEHAMSYCRDLGWNSQEKMDAFWGDFGYLKSTEWSASPSDEPRFLRKRRAEVPTVIQCDSCLKWRVLPFSVNPPASYPSDWHCALNPDPLCNRCGSTEQRQAIPEAVFSRPVVSQAEAAEKLQEEIRRKQAILAKLQPAPEEPRTKTSVAVSSSSTPPNSKVTSTKPESKSEPSSSAVVSSTQPTTPDAKAVADSSQGPDHTSPSRSLRSRRVEPSTSDPEKKESEIDVTNIDEDEKEASIVDSAKSRSQPALRGRVAIRGSARPSVGSRRGRQIEEEEEDGDEEESEKEEQSKEDEEEEEEEEEEETPPVKRRKAPALSRQVSRGSTRKASNGSSRSARKVQESESEEESEEEEEDDSSDGEKASSRKRQAAKKDSRSKPSSSLGAEGLGPSAVAQLADNYRACIRYFLPPSWKKYNKDSVSALTANKLVSFPQQEFFDEYERGLKALVGKLREENSSSRKQLENVRRMVASLLERILDKPTGTLVSCVSSHPDNHEIDDVLRTCLEKTVGSSKKSSSSSSSTTLAKSSAKKGSSSR